MTKKTTGFRPHQGIIFFNYVAFDISNVDPKGYEFPAPLGDYFFNYQVQRNWYKMNRQSRVSVPIRGLFF